MIKLKDLIHRDYKDKTCIHFDYCLPLDEDDYFTSNMEVSFNKLKDENGGYENSKTWYLKVYHCSDDGEEFNHSIIFKMEKNDAKLEDVAARGLNILMNKVVIRSIMYLQNIQFKISDSIEGM